MNKNVILLAALLAAASHSAMGDASVRNGQSVPPIAGSHDRIQDGLGLAGRIAGIFQRYDPGRKVVRISDVDYDLDPPLAKLDDKLRGFRNGQIVLFSQAGVSDARRNVLTSIEPQKQ